MNVVVCGKTSCGKSTQIKLIAEKFELKPVFTSTVFREMFEQGKGKGDWWETIKGQEFNKKRLENPEFDKKLDEKLMQIAKQDKIVFDSSTLAWLLPKENTFNIWLKGSEEVRVQRVAGRNDISLDEARKKIVQRDKDNFEIYKKVYGIDWGNDFQPYDLVLNTDYFNAEQVFEIISVVLEKVLKK